jgi:hypothetical protein
MGLVKNVIGPSPWWNTVPKLVPEASPSTRNGLSKMGKWRTSDKEGPLKRQECRGLRLKPVEAILLEELSERRGDGAEVPDESMVVARQAQKSV